MAYKYVALTPSGEQVRGAIEAHTEEAAEQTLWESGYRIITLRAIRRWPQPEELFPTIFGVKPQQVVAFSRQMATLIESGVAVLTSLELLQSQAPGGLRRVLAKVAQAVKNGSSFSDAVRLHPQVFPPIFGRMIAVGERTGSLEIVLRQLATHIEKEQAIIKRVKGAMAYPAFIMLLAIGVVAIVVTMALPPLISLFDEFDAELPLPTKVLLAVGNFASAYALYMAVALVSAVVAAVVYVRQPLGRKQLDHVLLRLPLIGSITTLANAARFSRTTAVLLRAGIPISEVMDLAIHTAENQVVRDRLRGVQEEMLKGEGLSRPLANSKLFPPVLIQMVEVGEETGTLDSNLETIAELYTREVDERISTMTSMIQPTMTLGVGLVVAFIALSIIMPMYDIMQSVRQP